jgi:hypothetical protein
VILRRFDLGDPWERSPAQPLIRSFGIGNRHELSWYLEGESSVQVSSLDEICHWLLQCEYVADLALFRETDFWQHPCTFEHLRKGDCEDHALWAWRKMRELGIDADFVSGKSRSLEGRIGGHAWVLFRDGGEEYLLEAVARNRSAMILPVHDARAHYLPHFAMRSDLQGFCFNGFLYSLADRVDEALSFPAPITSAAA